MRWTEISSKPIIETASSGATSSGNVASSSASKGGLGSGFNPDGDYGIYEKPRKTTKRAPILRR